MLTELKKYLMSRKIMDVKELALKLKTEPTVVREMLKHWIRKDRVRLVESLPSCGTGCAKCMPATIEVYEWQR